MFKNPCIYFLIPVVARATILGASIGDAIAIAALAAFYSFSLYLEHNKQAPASDKLKLDMDELRTQISGVKLTLAQRR